LQGLKIDMVCGLLAQHAYYSDLSGCMEFDFQHLLNTTICAPLSCVGGHVSNVRFQRGKRPIMR